MSSPDTPDGTPLPAWRRFFFAPDGRARRGRVIAAAVLAAAIAFLVVPRVLPKRANPQDFRTVAVERGDLEKTITAVGSLKPKDYVDVGTQVSGRVLRMHVDIGDHVRKGDLIAEIDPTVYKANVAKDRANLENLHAQLAQQGAELDLAKQQIDRNRRMVTEKAVSQDAVDQAESAYRVAAAKVEATRAQIKGAEATLAGDLANLGYTNIYTPLTGTVVTRNAIEGQTVNAVQSAPTLVQVANLDVMTVWAQVAEADVSRIKTGMPAYFTTLGMPERKWRGTVRQLQPTPETTNNVVLYNVLIDVDNREGLLLPSMTVQVFFLEGEAKNVPIAPMNALHRDRKAGRGHYTAQVLTDHGPEARAVTVGLTNRNAAEIRSGLEPGDKVIVGTAGDDAAAKGANGQHRRFPMGPRL